MANIVILIGSPRKGGNTDQLAHAFAEGAAAHNDVTIFSTADHLVHPCIGCDSCFAHDDHRCFQDDDMQDIYLALSQADIVVCASPVYMYGISAQLKCILDRLHTPLRNQFHIKKAALLLVAGAELETVFDPILLQYEMMCDVFKIEDVGRILVRGVREKGSIASHPSLKEAYALGASLR